MKSKHPRPLAVVLTHIFLIGSLPIAATAGAQTSTQVTTKSTGVASGTSARRSHFKCLAAASIAWKFGKGDKQLASVRDDNEFQELSGAVVVRQQERMSGLSQDQMMAGMNAEVQTEAKLMTDAVFPKEQGTLSNDELGERLKRHMANRYKTLGCLKK